MKGIKYILPLVFLFGAMANAQMYKPKKGKRHHFNNSHIRKPMYRWVTGDYSKLGIQFSFGPTYTLTNPKTTTSSYGMQSGTLVRYTRDPISKPGFFVELGMTHITSHPNRFIHYYDWGIGFKSIAGAETMQSKIYTNDTLRTTLNGSGAFRTGYLYGRFDVHSVFQMNPYLFLDNSLGVNGDYALMVGNKGYDGFTLPQTQKFQGNINVQLHYSIGLGIRPNPDKGFYFIPSVEVPVLGAYEWNGGTPSIYWFSSRYYPIQLRLKFVFLFRKGKHCPPVETNAADKKAAEQYQNR